MIKLKFSFEYLEVYSNPAVPWENLGKGTQAQSCQREGLLSCSRWGVHLRVFTLATERGFRKNEVQPDTVLFWHNLHALSGNLFSMEQCDLWLICSMWVNITVLLLFNDLLTQLVRTCKIDRICLTCLLFWPQWHLAAVSSAGQFFL